ncbi:MogA/MoaB family molybdenum cofactor biosynthesis protein [Methanobrevibacter filiformis]|uniref:Molybdenum cofactor biosynthesis protein B n=1 Tax=Methanobrevibacter filiformis TaxID=55758 RepID=A0A165Z041_9EURY|nr:MogA/MoaB family molybdenum cofactor biosynthesis protein [Methanobrevibacter filiformis]KZX10083.1 molybdenum cofactor biosynthesis protein B [Methanobrevibacter filiformis]
MSSKTSQNHKKHAPKNILCGVITLSDTKSKEYENGENNDISGQYLVEKLNEKNTVNSYKIIPDNKILLVNTINDMIAKNIDIIFTTGGTGIGSRDITIETLENIFEKKIVGFGELFRLKTYEELGAISILSRATAGVYKKTVILALPGSPNAVKLGLSLVIDELGHLTKHLKE